jgi:hypothetical protein
MVVFSLYVDLWFIASIKHWSCMAIKVLTPHSFKNILVNIPGFLEQNTSIIMHFNRLLTIQAFGTHEPSPNRPETLPSCSLLCWSILCLIYTRQIVVLSCHVTTIMWLVIPAKQIMTLKFPPHTPDLYKESAKCLLPTRADNKMHIYTPSSHVCYVWI